MSLTNYCISIFIGIITYFLLYLNKLQNLNNEVDNNNDNIKCLSNYNISLKVPLIISLIVLYILNNLNTTNEYLLNIDSAEINNSNNIDIFTDNLHWL